MKVNHRGPKNKGPAIEGKNRPAAYLTAAEGDRLRAANKKAVDRAAALEIEVEHLKKEIEKLKIEKAHGDALIASRGGVLP